MQHLFKNYDLIFSFLAQGPYLPHRTIQPWLKGYIYTELTDLTHPDSPREDTKDGSLSFSRGDG